MGKRKADYVRLVAETSDDVEKLAAKGRRVPLPKQQASGEANSTPKKKGKGG